MAFVVRCVQSDSRALKTCSAPSPRPNKIRLRSTRAHFFCGPLGPPTVTKEVIMRSSGVQIDKQDACVSPIGNIRAREAAHPHGGAGAKYWLRRGALLFAAAGLSFAASSAAAQSSAQASARISPLAAAKSASHDVKLTGAVQWTAVSGYSGFVRSLGNSNDYQAMTGITWYEDKDQPCKVYALSKHVNDWQNVAWPRWNGCPGNAKSKKSVVLGMAGSNTYATSVQVCTSGQSATLKRKMKGLKLWGKDLNKSSVVLTAEGSPSVHQNANCKVWHPKRSCPAGMVASKVRLHTSGVDGVHKVVGVALGCRKIVRK